MKLYPTLAAVVVAFAAGHAMADGKVIYEKTCAACHVAGVAGAPKLGDKAAWAPRTGAGKGALVQTVIKGKGAMPPKAGNAQLTEKDIGDAVDYMLASVK